MGKTKSYKAGEIVVSEGDIATSAYIIESGKVAIMKKAGGRVITIATLTEGEVFGEMGLIEDRPRSATVKALTDLTVRIITRDDFNEHLQSNPIILIPIIKSLFERLRQTGYILAKRTQDVLHHEEQQEANLVLSGKTPEARETLRQGDLSINKFPFLIGRYSKNANLDVFLKNDLVINEEKPYTVSRNHVAIVKEEDGIWIVDRGSASGTTVNGKELGGKNHETRLRLEREVNEIVLGSITSKFIFQLNVVPT